MKTLRLFSRASVARRAREATTADSPGARLMTRLEELTGGPPPDAIHSRVRELVAGRRVLVTGAGGSIGSEIVRQLSCFGASAVVMLDGDDTAVHDISLEIDGNGLLESPHAVLADIRDAQAVDRVFEMHRPEIVIHAAALKHLPLLERFPHEAWATNVHGTLNLLAAAQRYDVERFVNISTDKAASPCSVLGRSKRITEALCAQAAVATCSPYVSVRFGNVLGSRGSVVPTFIRQAMRGGPLSVTHPNATRFLMTIPQATTLALGAAAVGEPQDILVLDMGEPVRILDIARAVIDEFSPDCPIVFTGLRPGEKRHEELHAPDTRLEPTVVPGVRRMTSATLDPSLLPGPDAGHEAIAAFLTPQDVTRPAHLAVLYADVPVDKIVGPCVRSSAWSREGAVG